MQNVTRWDELLRQVFILF